MNTLVAEIFVVFLSGASLLFFLRTQLSSASHVHGLSAFYKNDKKLLVDIRKKRYQSQ
ncbi:hypothetical protein SDJN02_09252, partial [Cucurbita argyrosperma subsp. argyrosperma]